MRMTSLRVPTSAGLFLGLLLAAPVARADQKDDLYNKGTAAINSGDSIAARDAFCALPADFKDSATQCTTYKDAANRTLNRYKLNFGEGVTLMGDGKLDEAAAKFRTVKAGDYADQARAKLVEIDRLKKQQADNANAASAAENANKQKYDSGVSAFNSGNMDAAESALTAVTGSHQADAQTLLGKVRAYKAAVAKGQVFEGTKDFAAAKNAYGEAVSISAVGPATAALARVATAAIASVPSNPPPNTAATAKPPQPKPQIDASAYIADGNKALSKKQYGKARKFFNDVLTQDRNNQEAKDGLAQVNQLDTAQGNASDEDTTLKDIITTYYAGSYQDAEDRFKTYIYAKQGKKMGLANFYLGASMMTRYYLSGGNDQNLHREAVNKFKAAKAVDGFKAPDKFVSPKIMKAFEEAS
jgi:hypothetical protein